MGAAAPESVKTDKGVPLTNEPPKYSLADFPPSTSANPQASFAASTPITLPPNMNQSWADLDNDDSKAIEAFLANTPVHQTSAGKDANAPGHFYSGPPAPPQQKQPVRHTNHNFDKPIVLDKVNSTSSGLPMRQNQQNSRNTDNQSTSSHHRNAAPNPPSYPGKGGARPKTYNKAPANQLPRPTSSPKKVVTRNGWFTQDTRKRKRTRSSANACPTLSGPQSKPYRDIFVRSLRTDLYEDPEQMQDSIQDYCEERGVAVYYIRIMSNTEDGLANIKLQVAACDFETVMDDTFWPENVSVREWYAKPPNNQAAE